MMWSEGCTWRRATATPRTTPSCWGDDTAGQLGNGGGPASMTPVAVTATGATFTALGGGALFTCAIDTDSERWCWGNNSNAELGAGGVDGQHPSPELVDGGPAGWRVVDGAMSYGCGIATDDTLWCWGANGSGQLGGGAGPTQQAPQQVGGATDWYQLATDAQVGATCGIRDDAGDGGALYCWGNNDHYQLGTGDQTPHDTPFEIVGRQWLRIDLGAANACGIDATGALLCWGSNRSLQTADDPYRDHVGTIPSASPWPGATPEHVAVGYEHTCAIEGGQVYCWGDGSYGQLGDGNRATRLPRPVIPPP